MAGDTHDETKKQTSPRKPRRSFDGTTDASSFAAGAAAFAARWEDERQKKENASFASAAAGEVTVRWVEEPDPLVRRRVAPGYLVLEGARVDVFEDDRREGDAKQRDPERDDDDVFFRDAVFFEEDDQAARLKTNHESAERTTLLFSYHAVYSPSYRAPVLLARARHASPPRATLTHLELDRFLALEPDPGGVGSTRGSLERPRSSFAASKSSPRSVFAPWEHPHLCSSRPGDTGGCWLGAHPCETPGVMRLLFETLFSEEGDEADEADEEKAATADARDTREKFANAFFAAWFAFASRAAPGLQSVARR